MSDDVTRIDREPGVELVRHRRRHRRFSVPKKGIVATVVFVLVMLGVYEASRLLPAARDITDGARALQDARTALGTSPGDWTSRRIGFAEGLGREGESQVAPARNRIKSDLVLRGLRHIPVVGDQVQAVFDLADAADAGGRSFDNLVKVARVYDRSHADQSPPGPRLLTLIQSSAGPLADADAALSPTLTRLRADLKRPLLPVLRDRVQRGVDTLGPVADRAHAGAIAGRYVPNALGGSGSRTYLLLLPNPAELRPAGGFSGAVGTLTFTQGAPSSIVIKSQDQYNKPPRQPFDVPYPLARYFSFKPGQFEIGDAGWDPDFPSTAKLSEAMFTAETGQRLDGTISIDPYAIAAFLSVTGPVDVPGYGTFDSSTFFSKLDVIVNVQQGPGSGKQALPPIARAILERALTQQVNVYPKILSAFADQAHGRHIQVSLHSQDLQSAAARVHYDGAVVSPDDDYLMVVDGNVGATKGDYYVKKSAQLKAEVPASGISRHQLVMRYQMPLPVDNNDRALNPGDGSYHDYVRFYLPETANLLSFDYSMDGQKGEGGLDAVTQEHGKRVIAAFFRLPRGHTAELKLNYVVGVRGGSDYGLLIQKQAGTPGYPFKLEIAYPTGGTISRQVDLNQDAEIEVHW